MPFGMPPNRMPPNRMPKVRPGRGDMLGAPALNQIQDQAYLPGRDYVVGGRGDPNLGRGRQVAGSDGYVSPGQAGNAIPRKKPMPTRAPSPGGITGGGKVSRRLPTGLQTRERIY